METNELVNEFLIEKFREEFRIWHEDRPGWEEQKHLVQCETTAIQNFDCGWECGCYSCYTRNDSFEMSAHVGCDCGVLISWRYGYMYDLPDFIRQLNEYQESNCRHDERCEDCA